MPKLRQADLEMLLKKTDFSKDDIQDWYQIFLKECPDGKLDKVTVLDLLEGHKNKYFSRISNDLAGSGKCHADEVMAQIFTIFDKDESGCLDFVEFLLATSMTWSGTVEQKLR